MIELVGGFLIFVEDGFVCAEKFGWVVFEAHLWGLVWICLGVISEVFREPHALVSYQRIPIQFDPWIVQIMAAAVSSVHL